MQACVSEHTYMYDYTSVLVVVRRTSLDAKFLENMKESGACNMKTLIHCLNIHIISTNMHHSNDNTYHAYVHTNILCMQ